MIDSSNGIKKVSVGVVIPTDDRIEQLRRCLMHLFRQTILPDKIYIIYEKYSPASQLDLHGFAAERVVFLENQGCGPCAGRNTALRICLEEIAAFLDDDSFVAENWVAECIRGFRHSNYPAQLGRILWSRAQEQLPFQCSFLPRLRQKIYDSRDLYYTSGELKEALRAFVDIPVNTPIDFALHLSGGNSAIRTKFLQEAGFYDERFVTYYDKEMAYRIMASGNMIIYNPNLVVHHDHNSSMRRWLLRGVFSIQFDDLLIAMYPVERWDKPEMYQLVKEKDRIPLQQPLSHSEKIFLNLQGIVVAICRRWGIKLRKNPISKR